MVFAAMLGAPLRSLQSMPCMTFEDAPAAKDCLRGRSTAPPQLGAADRGVTEFAMRATAAPPKRLSTSITVTRTSPHKANCTAAPSPCCADTAGNADLVNAATSRPARRDIAGRAAIIQRQT